MKNDGAILRIPSAGAIQAGRGRFLKELIHPGRFTNAYTGKAFEITPAMIPAFAETFKTMRANGVKVPLPLTHDLSGDPEKNRGWVVDMFPDAGKLMGVLELNCEDPETLAKNSDVSIFSPPEFTDGKGNKYRQPILHVALCTDPLASGMEPFVAVASVNVPVYIEAESITPHADPSEIDWRKVARAAGASADLLSEESDGLFYILERALMKARDEMKDDRRLQKLVESVLPKVPKAASINRDEIVNSMARRIESEERQAAEIAARVGRVDPDLAARKAAARGDHAEAHALRAKRRDPELEKRLEAVRSTRSNLSSCKVAFNEGANESGQNPRE